jgi:DNA polymerase-1
LLYGHKWFWSQLVTGDTADFIPGLPGQGSKAAEKLLAGTKSNQDAYEAVSGLYKARVGAGWASYLVEQAGLLWMRTGAVGEVLDFLSLGVFCPEAQEAALALARRVDAAAQALAELQG